MEIAPISALARDLVSQQDFPTANSILIALVFHAVHSRASSTIRVSYSHAKLEILIEDDGRACTVDEFKQVWNGLCGVAVVEADSCDADGNRLTLRNGWISNASTPPTTPPQQFKTTIQVTDLFSKLPVRKLHHADAQTEESKQAELRRKLERIVLLAPGCTLHVTWDAQAFFDYSSLPSTLHAFASLFNNTRAALGLVEFSSHEFTCLISGEQTSMHHSKELQFVFTLGRLDCPFETELRDAINTCFQQRATFAFCQLTSVQKRTKYLAYVICLLESEDAALYQVRGKKNLFALAERILDQANWTRERLDHDRAQEAVANEGLADEEKHACFAVQDKIHFLPQLAPVTTSQMVARKHVTLTRELLRDSRVVGQVNQEFIVIRLESDGTLWCIDQHAADERIRFERFQRDIAALRATGNFPCKELESRLSITSAERDKLVRHREFAQSWGYRFTLATSAASVVVHTVPIVMGTALHGNTLLEVVCNAADFCPAPHRRALASKACRGAIMFGTPLTPAQCDQLVQELSQCDLPFQCAHGRPSIAPFKVQL